MWWFRPSALLVMGVVAGVVCLPLAGCGSDRAEVSSPPLSFSGPAAQTLTSSSGQLSIGIRWSPDVPIKGSDAAELTFRDAAGDLVDGLAVSMVPWMPAHGHGTSIDPIMMSSSPGVQIATPLYLFMSGEWQLRMTITGALDDSAVATAEIP